MDVRVGMIGLGYWSPNLVRNFSGSSNPTSVGCAASIGSGAVIRCGVEIGERSMIGAGSVVVKDVPPYTIVAGNPARVLRHLPRTRRK